MTFDTYFELLQQIEKPVFVFERFDNQETINTCLAEFQTYMIAKEQSNQLRKRLFCILVEKIYQIYEHRQDVNKTFFKFYDENSFYITYCNIVLGNELLVKISKLIVEINTCNYDEFLRLCQNLDRKYNFFEFGILDIVRKSRRNCYFNIITTEKDYFTLEIITVIHKVIA